MVPSEVETDRLLLRQWRDEDVEPLHEIYEQPEYLATMPVKTLEETRAQLDWLRSAWKKDGYCHWAACERAYSATATALSPSALFPRSGGCSTATGGAVASPPKAGRRVSTRGGSAYRTSRVCTRSRGPTTGAREQ